MLKNLLKVAAGLLLIAVLALVAGALYLRSQTLPQLSGTLSAAGLGGEVTVTRDQHGIPHIAAQTDEDAVYALGLVHAQDRAWQLDFQRRIAQGRLAEVLGEAALEQDRFLRTWGFQQAAQTALPALSERSRRLIAAYTAGVNAGFAQGKTAPEFLILGYEPEPWTDVDSVAWSKLMSFDLGGNWEQELDNWNLCHKGGSRALTESSPPYPSDGVTILSADELPVTGEDASAPGDACPAGDLNGHLSQLRQHLAAARELGMAAEPSKGSNNWVVSGQHTESGLPLLADDPHLQLRNPMLWYLAELKGDGLSTIGATIPGLPAVVIGRNRQVAWGVTNHNPDVQDLFVLPPNADVTVREEVIRVKGGEDVRLNVEESEYGPVVSKLGDAADAPRLALSWPTLMPGDTTLDAFLGINYAQDWNGFREAMRAYVAPSQSFVYADTSGNIGYIAPGRVPLRQGWDGTLPVQADGEHRWNGWIPFEELPQTYNPADGMVVTANNRSVPQGYPHLLNNDRGWADPYRARRITELLNEKAPLNLADMAQVQNDTFSGPWQDLRADLLGAPRSRLSDRAEAALDRLAAWDGVLATDSQAATLFEWWLRGLKDMGQDEWGQTLSTRAVAEALRTDGPLCAVGGEGGCDEVLAQTLEYAAEQAEQGPFYGRIHQALSAHGAFGEVEALAPIFNTSVAAPGGSDTVNVARPSREDGTLNFTAAASYRQLIDLADPDASLFTGTLGQSGNPLSRYARDQQAGWAAGEYLPMSMDPADWGQTQVLRLQPE
ncbi:penicillin acylase family protein [Deinococcus radiophilus]|uniref:Penicillin acylase family protein n=1 Tax=Deinococcus radiophilus TaxID=32062 RepID=A0A3S0I5K7_9DEIO|nr:penicillin acylase family protein [Deinococcus radiophilus]RTR25368.1 penicillin acylase family protein [Deinococcus radiophilus]